MREAPPIMSVPHLFRCPISLDLFTDPVTLCTGQTYDRSSIEKWLAAGNLTCPVTMQKLHDPITIVPNHTLLHLINQWLLQMGVDPNYLNTIDYFAALKLNLLQSHDDEAATNSETKLQIVQKIHVALTESSPASNNNNKSYYLIHQLGFLPLLLTQLFGKPAEYEATSFVEEGLSCVQKLLLMGGEVESLNLLNEESEMESFIVLFEHGSCLIKKLLCNLVEVISSTHETKQLCCKLGNDKRLLHEIISLVLHRDDDSEASDAGIKALSALLLCSTESNRKHLVQEGAINGLITYINNAETRGERSLAPMAMARIEQLLETEEGAKEELMNNPNGVYALVKMVFRVSDDHHEGSETAINSLMKICCDDSLHNAREEAICAGVLTQLLLLLQSQCSNMTKTKARMLLKLLRSKWAEEQNHYV